MSARFAEVVDGKVVSFVFPSRDEYTELHDPEFVTRLVPCGFEVEKGWILENGSLVPPKPTDERGFERSNSEVYPLEFGE
jgi:hypothetical protein